MRQVPGSRRGAARPPTPLPIRSRAPRPTARRGESRLDRVLEERHIRVGRIAGAGFGRLRGRVRIPVRLSHGKGTERAGSSLQLLQPKRLPKLRLGRAHAWDQGCGVRRLRLGLEPSHLLGGRSLPALELGARPGGGLQSLPLGLLHECAPGATAPSRRRPPAPRAGLRECRLPGDPSSPTRRGVHRRARRSTPRRPSSRCRPAARLPGAGPTASSGSSEPVPGREPPSGPLVADLEPSVGQHVAGDVEAVLRQVVSDERRLPVPELIERPATPGRASGGR